MIVRVGGRTLDGPSPASAGFQVHVELPAAETSVQVVTVERPGVAAAPSSGTCSARRRLPGPGCAPHTSIRCCSGSCGSSRSRSDRTSAFYVQDLATGAGAAWNARATFPGASALKLAIAVAALAATEGTPPFGSTLDRLLRQMLTYSDNAAANATERYYGGSTSGGSAVVNAMMRSLGLVDTEMYGGYELDEVGGPPRRLAGGIPLRVDSQPSWGSGKRTTAYDLAGLLRAVWLASGGRGPLRTAQPGFTPSDARYLLYLLAHVRDPGKIDREVGRLPGVAVLHKAGWINAARHDNGIVLWPGGALVVTVMTYRPCRRRASPPTCSRGGWRRSRCGASGADAVPVPGSSAGLPGARDERPRAGVHQARGRALGVRSRKSGVRPREATVRDTGLR